ncbi:hypothetical protein BDB00DRAFT_740663, partial [Zychaea mexicana]|uniref:uncharacterized protein n=1 Tax=Zychaea mexicana TaxID=64656 RepID=UPI0022FF0AC4
RFKYALAIIHVLLQKPGVKIEALMYDIARRIKLAIQVCTVVYYYFIIPLRGLLNNTKIAVSVFHAYAHLIKCQVDYNPRYVKGFGLTDGEGMERLWSYLGQFVS